MILLPLLMLAAQSAFDSGRLLPLAAGDWSYTRDSAGGTAQFGDQFLIRCDRGARRVTLTRLLPVAPPAGSAMEIATDTRALTYAAPTVSLGAFDPGLDAIAFTRGRFIVSVGGAGSIALPFEPEVARSIEDCRN